MASINISNKDYFWSYAGSFFRICSNILLLPLVLKFLSDSELGLWYVFIGIGSLVVILNFGFAPSIARNISYIWCGATQLKKEGLVVTSNCDINYESLKVVLKTCELIYLVIAGTALLILLVGGTLYINHIGGSDYILSWVIYSVGVFVNMYYSYYTSFLRGVGALAENNKAEIFSRCVQIILTLTLVISGYGLLGVSISYFISGIALRMYSLHAFYKYEDIGLKLKSIVVPNLMHECKLMFEILWHNASKDGFVTVANFLSTQANTLICSAVIGLSETGSYGLSIQFATIIGTFSQIPFTINHPLMQESSIQGDRKRSTKLFASSIISFTVIFIVMSVCLLLGIPIIKFFKPNFLIDNFMLILMLAYIFIYYLYGLFASYISTYNLLPYTRSFIVTALLATVLSFIVVKYLHVGIWGLVLSPLFVSLAYNFWKWPLFVFQNLLNVRFSTFVRIGFSESYINLRRIFKTLK